MMPDSQIIGIDASRSYLTPMTGTERYSRRIIAHLMALDPGNVRYRLYFNAPPPTDAPLGTAEVRTIPARRFWTHYRLSRELRANPVDLLFVPSHVLPLYRPPKSVVTIHDLGYLYEPESHTRSSRMQLKLTTRWNARTASHLIAISESTRNDLIFSLGVAPERITVIPHGVDERFHVLPEESVDRYRRAARLPEQFVLYLGTIQPRKNLARLIEAFELVAGDFPDLHFVIAGKTGWLSDPIRRLASSSRFRDRIHFLGYVPDPQLPLLYGAASALALPSLYEGFGLPVLEAMACGVPVLMSDRGALPELSGADAVIIDPTDVPAIAKAITLQIVRRYDATGIAERIRHANRFRWDIAARQTQTLLHSVLADDGVNQ